MPFRSRSIVREICAAFAVAVLYMLVLLLPLHQAAGLQRDLAQLGYQTLDTWSICAPLAQDGPGNQPAVVKCAVAGIGKNELAPLDVAALDIDIVRVSTDAVFPAPVPPRAGASWSEQRQPRAPPVLA